VPEKTLQKPEFSGGLGQRGDERLLIGKKLMDFTAPLPADMRDAIRRFREL
jgi:hypothetical protein